MNAFLPDAIFQPNCVLDSTFQNEGPGPVPISSENEPGSAGKSIPGSIKLLSQTEATLGTLAESPGTDSK